VLQGGGHVVPFVQPKQTDAEGAEVGAFVALQRHAGRGLQASSQKLFAALDVGVGGVAHHHAGRLETRR
jgi:hypothetical protein